MRPHVIIVHGWGGNPGADWYPWLKKELEHAGFSVLVPAMPAPEKP
ncbi:MAG: serine hydrolase family protein, partial [Candidatus Kerfeldbacteria bacterium]|nr:serine hydrolase family protein [Candidatus Kerfeldbacteria bacterium]